MKRKQLKEFIGEKHGYLEIVEAEYRYKSGKNRPVAKYKCICGNFGEALYYNIKSGNVKSCGCKTAEMQLNIKHGLSNERIYRTHANMLARCFNENHQSFHRYGGRGVTVCNEWKADFMNFYNWAMDSGYTEELTLERIDNNGNYCPENCTWITIQEQAKNKDNTGIVESCKRRTRAVKQIDPKTGFVIKEFVSLKQARKDTGITSINQCVAGISKTAGGYVWEYSH